MAFWTPQPGPQLRGFTCPANFIMFGGNRGGGKSDCLIGRHIKGAELFGDKWAGMIFRRKYKDFAEIRRRWKQLRAEGLPIEIIGGEQQPNTVRFKYGAEVQMFAVGSLDILDDFIGHQIPEVSIDEATQFPFFGKMIDKIRGFNRSPSGVPKGIFCTGNPGGAGHSQVKEFFKLGTAWEQRGYAPGAVMREVIELPDKSTVEETRIFIRSRLEENKYLMRNDPNYVAQLMAIRDPQLRRAWLDGDWDVFIGQAFVLIPGKHIIPQADPPRDAPIYMTFDWGFGKPFSVGWWYALPNGRVVRFNEWYGYSGVPDEGLRLADSAVADGILERERSMGLPHNRVMRISGPDCFAKRPDPRGGGQGPSTAEVFAERGLMLQPGDVSRVLKIRQFRERLELADDGFPMLQVMTNCTQFIRTVQELCYDEDNPEDIDTDMEDHVYDEACHICMHRSAHDPTDLSAVFV